MNALSKLAAVVAGVAALVAACLSTAVAAQNPPAESQPQTLVVDEATLDWIEKSNVAALREGVIDRMELEIGDEVAAGKPIGYLHSEIAELAVKKAKLAVATVGPLQKAKAQKDLAMAVVAINERLDARQRGIVSYEEKQKAVAELKVAEAMNVEEQEKIGLNQVELELAERTLREHTITAPFDGVVIERMKNRGESVRANEAVVRLGNLAKLRAYAYVPLEFAFRVKEGQIVDLQPRLVGDRSQARAPLPIERKKFRGKITFVDPQIQPVAETARRVYAEFDNKDGELSPGLKGSLTIYLGSENNPAPAAAPTVGARSPSGVDR
jgi:RND family efflux transporter MFP subunit